MASTRVTQEKPTSSTAKAGSSEPPGTGKPGLSHNGVLVRRRHPPMLRMVLEALQAREQRRGLSVVAIKVYIQHTYPTVDVTRFKYLLKQALDTGMRRGLLTRPLNSRAKGATGSFKLVPKKKSQAQPRKTPAPTAPGKAGEAQEKGPNKPSRANKGPGDSGQVEKAARKLGKAKEALPASGAAGQEAPKRGRKTGQVKAKLGEAKKVPPKPGKAAQAPSSANGVGAKSKAEENKSRRGNAEAHGKTKAEIKSSKPAANQVKNGAAKVPKGKAAQGAGEEPRAEAAAPTKGDSAKATPAHLARKTEAPEGLKGSTAPAKASSKTSSKKAKAQS